MRQKTKWWSVASGIASALMIACSQSSNPIVPGAVPGDFGAGPSGETLKIAAPPLVSPVNNAEFSPNSPIVLRFQNVNGTFKAFPVSYEAQVLSGNNVVATETTGAAGGSTSSVTVRTKLNAESNYSWRVRATYNGAFGPWSSTATFRTPPSAFLRGKEIFDPLTNGFSVGKVTGGTFLPGVGWRANTGTDGIDYDIETCERCRLEFDVLGFDDGGYAFGRFEPKILSMGDGTAFGSFGAFRDHDWKMHFSIRSDGDGTGLDVVWRNGEAGDGDPGDHRVKVEPGPRWNEMQASHVVVEWDQGGYRIFVNGDEWASDGWGESFGPPNHRIQLGCIPRAETFEFAIWRNVQLRPF
ncbi:MAG: hypothetical protein IT184_00785 [Acidobacteria bacterium]|nr:hypothetical protein [Acidobacteriota bacterium]